LIRTRPYESKHGHTVNRHLTCPWRVFLYAGWYYILFPALCFVLSRTRWAALVFIVTGLGLGWFQRLGTYGPTHVLSSFLLGMAAYQLLPYFERASGTRTAGPVVAAAIAFWARSPEPFTAAGLLLFAVLMITLVNPRGFLSRVLSRPAAVYLGEISYSLYMVHWPVAKTA
jgi:peptidoglycan/LPS O-acetylase OafA/YrhL